MCKGQEKHAELVAFMEEKSEEDLIEILHKTQDLYDYIPKEIAIEIAETLHIPLSRIYGVNTFYSRFSLVPKGKYSISVCMGTACYVKGAEEILKEFKDILHIDIGETTEDLRFSLVDARCVGDCASAPVVMVNEKLYRNVSVNDVHMILKEIGEEL